MGVSLHSFVFDMATSMRSGFLGTSLKDSRKVETAKAARSQNLQVQALFGGLKKAVGKGEKEAGKAAGKASKFGKKAAQKAPAPPKLAARKGTQTVKKAAKKSPAKGGSKRTAGWLGGEGGAQGLDKWYGKPFREQYLFFWDHLQQRLSEAALSAHLRR